MKKVIAIASVLIITAGLLTGCFGKGGRGFEKQAGDYAVTLKFSNNPPINGDNDALVTIKDKAGVFIADARVKIDYILPAMSGMPTMSYAADAMFSENEYMASVNFPMSGFWTTSVVFKVKGIEQQASFNLEVK